MGTWGQLLNELNTLNQAAAKRPPIPGGPSPHDVLRRKYLKQLTDLTGRATIAYETAWLEQKDVGPQAVSIHLGDVHGFMEAVSNVQERELDLILHSPGGSPDAAESIVEYLRTRFDHIRVIVPLAAMSAATMMALAADEIVMGAHSQLGPIDPQFTIQTPEGPRSAPGQAVLDQFDLAKQQCANNPQNLPAWIPVLRSLAPGLIALCVHQRELAEDFAARWLERYMFRDEADAGAKAKAAAAWFADFTAFKSHGRRVSRDDARSLGLKIIDLEADSQLQDAVLSIHHAIRHTFGGTGTVKLVENHHGRAYIEMMGIVAVQGPPAPPQLPGSSGAQSPQRPNRQQRRHPNG